MKNKKIILTAATLLPIVSAPISVVSCANTLTPRTKGTGVTFEDTSYVYEILTSSKVRLTKWKTSKPTGAISIPASVSNGGKTYTVSEIGPRAFESCSSLTGVTFPAKLEVIDNYAFYYCKNLVNVNFSSCNILTQIGDYAFKDCKNLTKDVSEGLVLPTSLVSIGACAFENCSSIMYLSTEEGLPKLKTLSDCAFRNCSSLELMPTLSAVEYIGIRAFGGCNKLVAVSSRRIGLSIPKTCKFIGLGAFVGTQLDQSGITFEDQIYWSTKGNLEDDNAHKPIKSVDYSTEFVNASTSKYSMTSLTKYTPISKIILSTGDKTEYSPSDTPKLEATLEPSNCTCKSVAYSCDLSEEFVKILPDGTINFLQDGINPKFTGTAKDGSQTTGTLSLSVVSPIKGIKWKQSPVFVGLEGTAKFEAEVIVAEGETRPEYKQVVYEIEDTESTGATIDASTGVLTAGSKAGNIKVIAKSKMVPAKKISQDVNIGTTLSIDSNGVCSGFMAECLADPENTIKVEFPDGVLKFPSKVKTISSAAFANTTDDEKMPSCITSLDFANCTELTTIDEFAFITYDGQHALSSKLKLPSNLTTIGQYAFYKQQFTTADIPASVENIGKAAFEFNEYLTTVDFATNCAIKEFADELFYNCVSLNSINIPNNVAEIKPFALYACVAMENGSMVFNNTSTDWKDSETDKIVDVSDPATTAKWFYDRRNNNFTFSKYVPTTENVTYSATGEMKASKPSAITNLVIPSYILDDEGQKISVSFPYNAFSGCTNLTDVVVPSTMTTFGNVHAFSGCTSLTNVNLDKVQHFNGMNNFSGCTSLKSIDLSGLIGSYPSDDGGKNTFRGCTGLESVTFSSNLKSLRNYNRAFESCTSLKEIDLSMCVNFINDNGSLDAEIFANCTHCETVKLPPNFYRYETTWVNQAQFMNLGTETENGCYVIFPGEGTYDLNSSKSTTHTFTGANVTKIRCVSASIYNAAADNDLGGLLTNTKTLEVPHGTTIASTSWFNGWTKAEGTDWDTYTKP